VERRLEQERWASRVLRFSLQRSDPSSVAPYGHLVVLLSLVFYPVRLALGGEKLCVNYLAYEQHQGPLLFVQVQRSLQRRIILLPERSLSVIHQLDNVRDLVRYHVHPLGDILQGFTVDQAAALGLLKGQQDAVQVQRLFYGPKMQRPDGFPLSFALDHFSTHGPTTWLNQLNLQLPPKRPVEQRLEQMLRLALRLPLLRPQALEFVDDAGELLLPSQRNIGDRNIAKHWER
jgi:hypothetical protein